MRSLGLGRKEETRIEKMVREETRDKGKGKSRD